MCCLHCRPHRGRQEGLSGSSLEVKTGPSNHALWEVKPCVPLNLCFQLLFSELFAVNVSLSVKPCVRVPRKTFFFPESTQAELTPPVPWVLLSLQHKTKLKGVAGAACRSSASAACSFSSICACSCGHPQQELSSTPHTPVLCIFHFPPPAGKPGVGPAFSHR